jgi:hypothetical protein
MIVKLYRIAGLLLLFALPSTAQTKERTIQEDNSPAVCGNGFHGIRTSCRQPVAAIDKVF